MSEPSVVERLWTERGQNIGRLVLAALLTAFILPVAPLTAPQLSAVGVGVGVLFGVSGPLVTGRFADPVTETNVRTVGLVGLWVVGLVAGFGSLLFLSDGSTHAFLHGALAFIWVRGVAGFVVAEV